MKKILTLFSIIAILTFTYYSFGTLKNHQVKVLPDKSEISNSIEKTLPLMIFDIFQVYVN